MNKKVSPLGVLAILLIAAALVYFGWPLLTGAGRVGMKPPFTQEKLAQAIVTSFNTDNKQQFTVTLYGYIEMEAMYSELIENAEKNEVEDIEMARNAERRGMSGEYMDAVDSWDRIDASFEGDEQATLQYVSYDVGSRDFNHFTRKSSYDKFTIEMRSNAADYLLVIDRLVETDEGWKISGGMKLKRA